MVDPCSKILTDHALYMIIKMVLCGYCVCYFSIPSMRDANHDYFHHMRYFQMHYVRCAHTHMLHLYWFAKGL